MRSIRSVFVVMLFSAVIAACGGGADQLSATDQTSTTGGTTGGNTGGSNPPAMYTVSGTIGGLSGSGLVIRNNGTPVTVSNNTFSVSLAGGSAYAFTVGTQPSNPTQQCTISNASGTVGSTNITNVAVSCSTNRYTVSGTISGLTGSGLVIRNNGTPVTVSNNAFSVSMASGSTYAFTIGTQPSNPTQLCTIANGSGTVGSSNISNVAVSCAASTTPSYTVSGTITGLVGGGLMIMNNGTAVPISNNAFSVSLASGSAYAFTIGTQPSNPSQQCTVTNGAGTVGTVNISNVAVSCSTRSYTVSGTISGLSGSGLVIRNNGTPVTISNNAFSVSLASGSAYAFTVGTQPSNPAQQCTIANASGTVGSSNISNVAVSCSTTMYTVSGTISGLSGTGLVIRNNGTAVTISNNAFSVSLASGSIYAFTIGTQPSSPAQQCTISNGSGTVGSANISNVAVSCSTTMYTVSGTISGLSGTGLVIRNNGAPVTISNNAFSVSLSSGSAYAFTIGTQPSSPAQQCTIANASGTVGSLNITNVVVTCSTTTTKTVTLSWTAPTTREDGSAISLSDIGSYILSYGTSPTTTSSNTITINDGSATQYTVTLPAGTYYFVIRAVDSNGTQGLMSAVLQKTL
ncbi:MAG: hypothetical protein GC149_12450 [Gammaproteobacteria bacterium]|nr:hypothetical protein [Gammaproteobacteria bacterium]